MLGRLFFRVASRRWMIWTRGGGGREVERGGDVCSIKGIEQLCSTGVVYSDDFTVLRTVRGSERVSPD